MSLFYLTHSPIATVLLSQNGELYQILDDFAEDSINQLTELDGNIVSDSKLVYQILQDKGIKCILEVNNELLKSWRINRYEKLLEQTQKISNFDEYMEKIRETAISESRDTIKKVAGKRDELAAQIIHTIDDLQKSFNTAVNRLIELYNLHFPELADNISNPVTLAKIIVKGLQREKINKSLLDQYNLTETTQERILQGQKDSLGGDLELNDLQPVKQYAQIVISIDEQLSNLENWIDQQMETIAPNLTAVCGANVGARLIAAFGTLDSLAKKSSSKIQIIGAEKALYAALKSRGSPPKHGIIFQIPEIGNSPFWIRGKLARAYAAKIAIAARLDRYGGELLGNTYRSKLRELEKSLREQYPVAPEKKKERDIDIKGHPKRRKKKRRRRSKKW